MSKEKALKKYLNKMYGEAIDDPMYGPDIHMSKIDFKSGYKAKEKEIKDLINALKSQLSEYQTPKIGKRLDLDVILNFEEKIRLLKQLI